MFDRLAKSDKAKIIEYHKWKLSRTYPSGSRTDSSNYDPQPLWKAGFQIGEFMVEIVAIFRTDALSHLSHSGLKRFPISDLETR